MTTRPPEERSKRPANRRGSARLAAVQALYQMDIGAAPLTTVLTEFEEHRLGQEIDGEQYRAADALFFRDLVTGVVKRQRDLDPKIHAVLAESWPLARIDSTLRAILRAGIYELSERKDVPAKVVIAEYMDLAHAFFDGDVPPLVNAVLDRLARELRPTEFGAPSDSDA